MNFLVMQQELSDRLGAYDQSVSGDATKLKRWLNMAQQDITSKMNWPFMISEEIVQTSTDITTGTVTITDATTALTFSSAPAASVANWFIKFSTSNNWYQITSHTAASTSAVITPALGEGASISGGTYKLRKLFYKTSTPLDSILDMKQFITPVVLESIPPTTGDMFLPLYWDSGTIYKYISSVYSATDGLQFSFLYSPSSVLNVMVRGIKKLSDLSSDSDISIIPSRWHSAIVDMGAFYGFSSLDDTRAQAFYNKANQGVEDMRQVYGTDLGRHRVMRPVDTGLFVDPAYTLPSTYGRTA